MAQARFTIEDDTSDGGFTISDDASTPANMARASGADLPSPVQGYVNALQGPLFGFLDEMTGAAYGLKSLATGGDYLPAYREARDVMRGAESQFREDYPLTSKITPLVASAPVLIGGPQIVAKPVQGATAAGNMARNMGAAAATAAGYGALSAAGESESQGQNLLSDILSRGASSGMVAGASVPIVNILAGITGRGARMLPPSMQPAGASTGDFATRKVAEQLIRDKPEGVRKPMERLLAHQRGMGNEARIVDLGGAQTHRTLDTLATLPGRTPEAASQAAIERASGRGASIMRDADRALGTQGAKYLQTLDELETQAMQASKPYYDQIREVNIPVQGGLRAVLEKANKYLGGADEYAATLGITGTGLKDALIGTNVIGVSGNRVKTAVAPLSRFDALKQYLYDTEQAYLREGSKNQAAAITGIRRQLIDELDKLSPKDEAGRSIYKMARDAYAGPSQLKDAAELGRKAFDADKDFAIREAIKDMSPSEVAAMRVGLMQAIREKAGTQTGQTWLMNNWKNPATRERIQLAFGDQSGRFISALVKQSKLKMLESSVGGGSQTATRGANAEDLGIEAVKEAAAGMASVKAGDVPGAMNWIQKLVKQTYIPEPIRNEMGRILLMKGPEARAKLQQMVGILDLIARQQAKQAGTTGAFVGRQNPWLTGGNATNGGDQ